MTTGFVLGHHDLLGTPADETFDFDDTTCAMPGQINSLLIENVKAANFQGNSKIDMVSAFISILQVQSK